MDATVLNLIKKGNDHFDAAAILSASEKSLPNLVCFHCEQCADKYLKAFLTNNNIFVKKNDSLFGMLKKSVELDRTFSKLNSKTLISLSGFGVDRLYSSYNKEATSEEISNFVNLCKELKAYIDKKIPQ